MNRPPSPPPFEGHDDALSGTFNGGATLRTLPSNDYDNPVLVTTHSFVGLERTMKAEELEKTFFPGTIVIPHDDEGFWRVKVAKIIRVWAYICAVINGIAAIIIIAAIATPNWYYQDWPAGGDSWRIGIFRECIVGGSCSNVNLDRAVGLVSCSHSRSDYKARVDAVRALSIIALLLAAVTCFGGIFSGKIKWRRAPYMLLTSVILTGIFLGGAIIRFVFTMESWFWCNRSACGYLKEVLSQTTSCTSGYGYSLALICVALALVAISAGFCIGYIMMRPKIPHQERERLKSLKLLRRAQSQRSENPIEQPKPSVVAAQRAPPTAAAEVVRAQSSVVFSDLHASEQRQDEVSPRGQSKAKGSSPSHSIPPASIQQHEEVTARAQSQPKASSPTQGNQQPPAQRESSSIVTQHHVPTADAPSGSAVATEPPVRPADLPEGDWTFDPASGLYWSDTEFLYFDHEALQYYDPKSEMWYDPEKDIWYKDSGNE